MEKYVINATSVLANPYNADNLEHVANDLKKISKEVSSIQDIVLRGGGVVDVIAGIEPNDIDLFYSYTLDGINSTHDCVCDSIREKVSKLDFAYFKDKSIDLENSFEKEPRLSPIQRTCGLFSYHTDYNSQFAIDRDGFIWTNIDALKYYLNGVYEVRYEGFSPWAYFPRKGDSHNYWAFQVYVLIRGIGYITKRNLIPGKNFMLMVSESKYLINRGIEEIGIEGFQRYAKSKIKTRDNFEGFVKTYIQVDDRTQFEQDFQVILQKL